MSADRAHSTSICVHPRSSATQISCFLHALQVGADVWVIHAFQKKAKSGIATPRQEIDLVRDRLKRLKEIVR